MNEKLLSPEQRELLEALSTREDQVLARRAAILLAYDDGNSTEQIAQTLNISERLARYWRHAFLENGMSIFNELGTDAAKGMPKNATGRKIPSEPLAHRARTRIVKPVIPPPSVSIAETAAPPSLAPVAKPAISVSRPNPPKKAGVKPEDSLTKAGRKVLHYQLAHMLSHEDAVRLGKDIEALHDMRVASRRLRVALEIFEPYFPQKKMRSLRRDMRDLGRALGRVRDLDVFIEKTRTYIQTLPADETPALQPLLDTFVERRVQAHTALMLLFDQPETRQFLMDFEDFLSHEDSEETSADEQPKPIKVSHLAPIFIYQRLAEVRAFEDILEHASLEQLHSLRSAFKYLRYTIDFFREALGDEVKNVLEDLKTIQDHLGNLNDAHIACGMLNEFLAEWEARQNDLPILGRQNPQGILACLSERSQERHRLLTEFPQVWQNFNRPEFRMAVARMLGTM